MSKISTKTYKFIGHHVNMPKKFHVIIEQDPSGGYVGSVPELPGCHSQGESMDDLMKNIKEAIELCLEVQKDYDEIKFIGVQEITV